MGMGMGTGIRWVVVIPIAMLGVSIVVFYWFRLLGEERNGIQMSFSCVDNCTFSFFVSQFFEFGSCLVRDLIETERMFPGWLIWLCDRR